MMHRLWVVAYRGGRPDDRFWGLPLRFVELKGTPPDGDAERSSYLPDLTRLPRIGANEGDRGYSRRANNGN